LSTVPREPGRLRLGVNIDHVATVRNARGGRSPDPVRAALLAEAAGADGITAHLREDRRHITDEDIDRLTATLTAPLNLEMAATEEMLDIALKARPHAACLVPERREERTTEGGLDAARSLRAPVVELHTGTYCEAVLAGETERAARELERLRSAAAYGASLGLEIHAGHGLDYESVGPVAAIPELAELNIGHFLVGEAIFVGLAESVAEMRRRMDAARAHP